MRKVARQEMKRGLARVNFIETRPLTLRAIRVSRDAIDKFHCNSSTSRRIILGSIIREGRVRYYVSADSAIENDTNSSTAVYYHAIESDIDTEYEEDGYV